MTSFTIVAVRTGEEPADDLYPDPGDAPDTVELEDGDGEVEAFWAKYVSVTAVPRVGRPTQILKLTDVAASITITESRVAVACSKYDKGGGWTSFSGGGVIMAAGLNAVSRARANRRRRGKMLVGHVRYDWLGVVEAKDRSGILSNNSITLTAADPIADGVVLLQFWLDKRTPAVPVAELIAGRAADHLAQQCSDTEMRLGLERFAVAPIAQPLASGAVQYVLPPADR